MSSYFQEHSGALCLDPWETPGGGLRDYQEEAVARTHAHFQTSRKPALICMPMGVGKMTVLMALCFKLEAKRVLVVTPWQLMREQIAEDIGALRSLKNSGTVPLDFVPPKVKIVRDKITSDAQWQEVLDHDVVVANPQSLNPSLPDVIAPPEDAFDLIIFDEAEYSQADAWSALMDHFAASRQVLLTATPFRDELLEIKAQLVYRLVARLDLRP